MKRKLTYSIALVIAATALTGFAADDVAQLRSELDTMGKRLEELEKSSGSGASAWAGKVKVKGDLRYRFQHAEAEDTSGNNLTTTKNIQRVRARLGIFAEVNDFTTAGVGIRTADKANSGNVTLGDHFDGFEMSISLAYFTIAPEDAKYGAASFGKMKQPWKSATDLIWDADVNPEGIAYAYSGKAKNTGIIGSLGYFRVVEEKAQSDLNLGTAQLGVAQPIGEKTKVSLGGSFYGYDNATQFTDPVLPGNYMVDYRIAEGFAEVGVKDVGPIPFKLYGSYVNNTATSDNNDGYCVGIKFGDAKKGKWEAKYDYRDLGLYAAPAYFTDSDFADGGTGVKGHRIKAKYNFAKNLAGGLTYINSLRTPDRSLDQDQQFNTLMLDLMVKF
jgi:hypothetical protein